MEMEAESWNILCEGPSIYKATPADLLPGPLVAINDAVRLRHLGIPKLWAVIDPVDDKRKSAVWLRNRDHLPLPLTVWTPERRKRHWDMIQLPKGLTVETHPRIIPKPAQKERDPWDEQAEQLTVFMTIRECVTHGGKHIRIFGCDMQGKGNCVIGFNPTETQTEIDRWSNERRKMTKMVARGADKGIKIERWQPQP